MSKKKIVYLHPHFTLPGGAGNVVLESACRLSPDRYNVHILCIQADRKYKEMYPSLSFVEIGGPLPDRFHFWLSLPYVQYKVHQELNRLRPHIIIPQVLPSNWWAFIYKLFHKDVACIWYCHEPSAFIHIPAWIDAIQNPLMRFGAKALNPMLKAVDLFLTAKATDTVVTNSRFTKKQVEKTYRSPVSDVIYPGVNGLFFTSRVSKKPYLLMVGRLTRFKNMDVAIKAMKKLKHSEYLLRICGDGEERSRLMALAQEYGVTQQVEFLGAVSADMLAKLYSEAAVLLMTSKREPFGMVPLEAMASGTPVIAMNSGGIKETVIHGQNGLLLNNSTPGGLTEAIDTLLSEKKIYNAMRQAATETAVRFSWENHVKRLEVVLNTILCPNTGP